MTWGEKRIRAECERHRHAQREDHPMFRADARYMWIIVNGPVPPAASSKWGKERDEHNRPLFEAFMAALKGMNFWVAKDREVHRQFRSLSFSHRMGGHRTSRLRFRAEYYATGMKVEFYPDHNPSHGAGPKYASDKMEACDHRTALAFRTAIRRLKAVAASFGCVDVSKPELEDPRDVIAWKYWSDSDGIGWHTKDVKSIDDPRKGTNSWQEIDGDKRRTVNGDVRFFRDRKGRLWQGRVYYGINDSWYAICGGNVINVAGHELFAPRAGEPRKAPTRFAVDRVKRLIASAVEREDFEKAAILRDRKRVLEAQVKP